MPTILRLMESWLKFSKHKPKCILVFGYFENRFEFEAKKGEFLRLSLHDMPDYAWLDKTDKAKLNDEANKFKSDPDTYIKYYADKIDEIIKDYNHVKLNVHDYAITNYTIGRDLQFLNFNKKQYEITKTDSFKKNFFHLSDELFSDAEYHKLNNFTKTWISHYGIDFHKDVAKHFLQNLTI